MRRRILSPPKLALLVLTLTLTLVLAASASATDRPGPPSSVEPSNNHPPGPSSTDRRAPSSSAESTANSLRPSRSRWLTYACGSKNDPSGGRRGLLERMLTHPCSSKSTYGSTANDLYNRNTERTKTAGAVLVVILGIIAGVLAILGMLYLIDRETFTELTGVKECSCTKPRIDNDEEEEDDTTPYERDRYLTEETAVYLDEKRDREVEAPKRRIKLIQRKIRNVFKSVFWCCFRTKDYDGADKYQIPWTGSEEEEREAGKINLVVVFFEEIRLRLCWRPTKEYDENDKYGVEGDGKDDDISIAASSYESAEKGTTPW